MTNKINLLPQDLNRSSGTGFVGLWVKRMSIVFGVLVFAGVVLGVVLMIVFTTRLANLNKQNAELSDQVKKLSQTEQRLFLVKDRIARIKRVIVDKQAEENIGNLDQMTASMSSEIGFKSLDLKGPEADLTLSSSNSSSVNQFINFLTHGGSAFRQIILKNLGFNVDLGYMINLQLF